MALLTFLPEPSEQKKPETKRRKKQQKPVSQSSWNQIKSLLTCKQVHIINTQLHNQSKKPSPTYSKLSSSCNSICSFKDVIHGNARVVHRADNSPETSSLGQDTRLLRRKTAHPKNGAVSSSSRGMQLRKLSGCYECRTVIDPSRYPIPRSSMCPCPQCGEVFTKIESLELHQAVRHAVSELGPDDSGRNIVEIIFKSSWLKKDSPICKIERILKVHNTQRTIQRFEECRDAVKTRALTSTRKNPRCAADGNELLRFHCNTLSCDLGSRGSTGLCGSTPGCGVCTIIRLGFQNDGVRTTASSGRADDSFECADRRRRAMLVCRVIAGRVKRITGDAAAEEEITAPAYDAVSRHSVMYSNMEELIVFNPKAILPCFVVIYEAMQT